MCAVKALCECSLNLLFRCQKTVPQVLLRWSIQKNYITIPKTSRKERILENADIFDFALSAEDMKILVSINRLMLFPLRRMNSLILDSDNFNFKVLDSFRIGLRRYFLSWQFSDSFGSHSITLFFSHVCKTSFHAFFINLVPRVSLLPVPSLSNSGT